MFNIVKKVASSFLTRTKYNFSAGYFSHRTTADNNDATPFDFT